MRKPARSAAGATSAAAAPAVGTTTTVTLVAVAAAALACLGGRVAAVGGSAPPSAWRVAATSRRPGPVSIPVERVTIHDHKLLKDCELPSHSSINVRRGRWLWNVQVIPTRDDVFSLASNLPAPRVVEGILITRQHVLTTSVDIGADWERLKVRIPTNDGEIELAVVDRTLMPGRPHRLGRNNFALLKLAEPVMAPRHAEEIRPVCMFHKEILSTKSVDDLLTLNPIVSSYTTSATNNLCEQNVKFIGEHECRQQLEALDNDPFDLTPFVCDSLDKCNDMIGSVAMVQENDERFYLIGMLTYAFNGYAPYASYPSLFQRITPEHVDWMRAVVFNNETWL